MKLDTLKIKHRYLSYLMKLLEQDITIHEQEYIKKTILKIIVS